MSVRRNIIIKIYKQDLLLLGKRNRMIIINNAWETRNGT